MLSVNTLIIGSIVLDRNNDGEYDGPGGSSYFITKTLNLLKIPSMILSQRGEDYPKSYLQKITIFPENPSQKKTITFENNVFQGKRTQKVINEQYAQLPYLEEVPKKYIHAARYLIFCPIINNLSLNKLKEWKRKTNPKKTLLLPQGLLRKINEDGSITKHEPENLEKYIREVDYAIFSDEDIENSDIKAQKWSKNGPVVIVTLDKMGCDVYINGNKKHFDTYPNDDIKSLIGLGDIFAGVFLASIMRGKPIDQAVKYANAGASLAKSYNSQNLSFTWEKIEDIVNIR